MVVLLQKEPVELSLFAPLSELAEILPHEQQLFAGMAEHKGIACLQVFELVVRITGHLVQHGTLQMYDLVVRDDKHILFAVSVHHGESHLVVVEFAE